MRPISASLSFIEHILSRPWACLFAALLCIIAESWIALDQAAQSVFFRDNGWLISKAFHRAHDMTLYTVPKLLVGAVAIAALAVVVLGHLPRRRDRYARWRVPCLVIFLSICLTPLAVSALKAATGVYGPSDLLPYGGKHAHIGVLEHVWLYGRTDTGRSFPAGHASGGFALMALYYLPLRPGIQIALTTAGFALGWLMGLYQMARGEHFLTHTLTTMLLALGIIGLLARRLHPANG